MYSNDDRVVITLDAGGTNFVFGAIRSNGFMTEPLCLPALAENLDKCLGQMVRGFENIIKRLPKKPVAISFAFPGPADYPRGIIGGYLPNFPSFRNGVALKDFLEDRFDLPVFINNDGDLYAYGEALAGVLPEINTRLRTQGSCKQYKNLIGCTLGTGLGIGTVINGQLNSGDNSCVEAFCLPNKFHNGVILEDSVSIRAVKRVYAELTGITDNVPEPDEIYIIAKGENEGNREAGLESFRRLGEAAGEAIATAVTIIDGLVVIGGGISGAREFWMPALLKEMRANIRTLTGDTLNRVQMSVYDLDSDEEFATFCKGEARTLKVHGSDKTVVYDPQKRIGIATTKIGASKAISLGAYAYALNSLDNIK